MADAWRMGSYATDTLTGKTQRTGSITGTFNNNGACWVYAGANYTVPVGKTLYITGYWMVYSAAAMPTFQLRYADDAAMTGTPVPLIYLPPMAIASGNFPIVFDCYIAVPAGKYVGLFSSGGAGNSATVQIIGYEV